MPIDSPYALVPVYVVRLQYRVTEYVLRDGCIVPIFLRHKTNKLDVFTKDALHDGIDTINISVGHSCKKCFCLRDPFF